MRQKSSLFSYSVIARELFSSSKDTIFQDVDSFEIFKYGRLLIYLPVRYSSQTFLAAADGANHPQIIQFIADPQVINATEEYDAGGPYHLCYIKAWETLSTVKGRVASVAKIAVAPKPAQPKDAANDTGSDDEEDAYSRVSDDDAEDSNDENNDEDEEEEEVKYDNQRDLLMCRSIKNLRHDNLLENVPGQIVQEVKNMLTPSQRDLLFPHIEKVPMGVLLILGPAGTGKSFALSGIILLKLGAGKRVSVIAPSNVAAANIANKVKAADKHGRLLLRPWSSCEEENALMRYVPGGDEWRNVDSSPWRGHDRFIPEMSVAEAVLMMCGQLPTTNQKLLSLRQHNIKLAQTLATHPVLRDGDMKRDLRSRARRASKAVMAVADCSSTTSAQALSGLVKPFTKSADSTVVEEAGNAVDVEIANSHNGDQKDLTLVGDPKPLPPPSIAKDVRHPPSNAPHQQFSQNGRPVDPFTDRM
jgi:hypothetical protein